jgi:general secretion pathway protein G
MEILVALVLIGLLVGALVPTVLNQLGRGDTSRAIEDLAAIENGIRSFRVDVRRWPGDIEDLQVLPTMTAPADAALAGQGAYTPGLLGQWNGPYVERLTLNAGNNVVMPIGGTIGGAITTVANHATLSVTGLADDQIAEIDAVIDNGDGQTTGRIRWTGTAGSSTMQYLAVSLN